MADIDLAHLSAEQLEELKKSISTIQSLTNGQLISPVVKGQSTMIESSNSTVRATSQSASPIFKQTEQENSTTNSQQDQSYLQPPFEVKSGQINVPKKRTPSFLVKRNITLPLMSKLSDFKAEVEPNSDVLGKIHESLNLLQETYTEIGLSQDDLLKSESYLLGRLSDLIHQADFTKQSLNLEIMTIMNDISEIDNILTRQFKYDYIIDESLKKTIQSFNDRFENSISNTELSVILLKLNPNARNLLDLKEQMLKVFNQLHPRYTNKVIDLSQKTLRFHYYYQKLDGVELKNKDILKCLPSLDEANAYKDQNVFNFDVVDHIINNTVYKDISHGLFSQVEDEIANLKIQTQSRIEALSQVSTDIVSLYLALFTEKERQNGKALYINELQQMKDTMEFDNIVDLVYHNVGLKTQNLQDLRELHESLVQEKAQKDENLSNMKSQCQKLWSRLNQDQKMVSEFLEQNDNLRTESLSLFSVELERLNELKLKNIVSFVEESREKIRQSWDFLMYSMEERNQDFPIFFNTEESQYDENFLDLHNEYFEKLSGKIEELRPLLELIKEFEMLLVEKQQLEEDCRDASRLLQRNSFRILKEEEKTRIRLQRQIPQTIHDLKLKLQDYEEKNKKPLLVEGKVYYDELVKVEENLNTRPSTKRRLQQQKQHDQNQQLQQQQQQQQQQQAKRIASASGVSRSTPSTIKRRPLSAPSSSFAQSKSVPRNHSKTIEETPVRRGLPKTSKAESTLRLNKASVSSLNDINRRRKPLTPTSQIISPLYSSPERTGIKRTLSPSRAVVSKIGDEPATKKGTSGLRSPIRSIGVPMTQSKVNILPTLRYGGLNYPKFGPTVKSPIQLSSSDVSDIDDEGITNNDVNKENGFNYGV